MNSRSRITFKTQDESGKRSVQILVAVEGCGIVEAPGANPVTLARGDAVVVPAAVGEFQVRPQWSVEFLKAIGTRRVRCRSRKQECRRDFRLRF